MLDNCANMISIIIPVYNVENYLEKCLESVLFQSYENIEIILINDGSTDNSLLICQKWANKSNKIQYINKPNEGVSAARNVGLLLAKGSYITFIDPDDYIESDMYEKMINVMKNTPVDAVFCGYYLESEVTGKVSAYPRDNVPDFGNSTDAIFQMLRENGYMTAVWNKLFRRQALIQNDGSLILFNKDLIMSEDEYWLDIIVTRLNRVAFLSEPLYHWVKRKGTATSSCLSKTEISKHHLDQFYVSEATLRKFETIKQVGNICKAKYFGAGFLLLKNAYYTRRKDLYYSIYNKIWKYRRAWKKTFLRTKKQSLRMQAGILMMKLNVSPRIVKKMLR